MTVTGCRQTRPVTRNQADLRPGPPGPPRCRTAATRDRQNSNVTPSRRHAEVASSYSEARLRTESRQPTSARAAWVRLTGSNHGTSHGHWHAGQSGISLTDAGRGRGSHKPLSGNLKFDGLRIRVACGHGRWPDSRILSLWQLRLQLEPLAGTAGPPDSEWPARTPSHPPAGELEIGLAPTTAVRTAVIAYLQRHFSEPLPSAAVRPGTFHVNRNILRPM